VHVALAVRQRGAALQRHGERDARAPHVRRSERVERHVHRQPQQRTCSNGVPMAAPTPLAPSTRGARFLAPPKPPRAPGGALSAGGQGGSGGGGSGAGASAAAATEVMMAPSTPLLLAPATGASHTVAASGKPAL
jgi:hypothetical protein